MRLADLPEGSTTRSAELQNDTQPCRICADSGPHKRFVVREMMFGTRESFAYRLCRQCGCLQIEQIPNDLQRHYPSTYYSHTDQATPWEYWRFLARLRIRPALF